MRVRGTVYRAFRAPTLNELYRDFRAGNAETRSNPGLEPETMFGSEVGADLRTRVGRLSTTFFRHDLSDLITNVTLSTTPQLITRQRQNAGAAIARGVEANWHMPILEHLSAELAYLYADSRFSTGERIPQVPRHSGSAQVTWFREGTLVSGGLRAYSSQFEDDRNQFLLPGFATLQIAVRQKIRSNLSATIALDNMLDREYAVGITAPAAAGLSPLVSIGSPRLWRAGLRWDGPLR
ncbi:MAG TPA: TonB-dependent receptor [Bryobacteraceae bacterium]|nr:TonB-dependent receptor [Bryobacteraceae bacterium]